MVDSNLPPAARHSLGLETKGIRNSLSEKVNSTRIQEERTKDQGPETESEVVKAVTEKSKQTGAQW